jgi:transposase
LESITCVGIDAAQDWLDVEIQRPHSKRRRFPNTVEGIALLRQDLGEGSYVIAIESSGRYEALARHELQAAGYEVRMKNPRQMRRLVEGLGVQAKTDGIDARMLCETAELGRSNEPRSKEREALGDLSRTIECLKKERSRHLKRMKVPGFSKIAIRSLRAMVKATDAQLEKLEKEFVKLVKKSGFARRYELLLSVPGVGPALARILVCELPEKLEDWSLRQISSYAGVAAIDDSSGKTRSAVRVPSHCNTHLKGGLYMPAISLVATRQWAKAKYRRLREKGRSHQQAIIAVMHKQLVYALAVLKRGSPWQDEPPKRA